MRSSIAFIANLMTALRDRIFHDCVSLIRHLGERFRRDDEQKVGLYQGESADVEMPRCMAMLGISPKSTQLILPILARSDISLGLVQMACFFEFLCAAIHRTMLLSQKDSHMAAL